jgi:hypothetical protein
MGESDLGRPQQMRVSDAEREHVTGLLAGHMSAGRLTPDEYAERVDAATHATTRAQLNALVLDLPGAQLQESVAREVLDLGNTMGDLRRDGEWLVPATIRVSSWCGNARIDTSKARFTSPVVTLEVAIGVGNVDLVVPHGATVDVDDARISVGTIIDKTVKSVKRGNPHFVLRGTTRIGNIKIKHP